MIARKNMTEMIALIQTKVQYTRYEIAAFLNQNAKLKQVVLVINYLFRSSCAYFMAHALPFSLLTNYVLELIPVMHYTLTAEGPCPVGYTFPAILGALSFEISKGSLIKIIQGVAFSSLTQFGIAFVGILPAVLMLVGFVYEYKDVKFGGNCCS